MYGGLGGSGEDLDSLLKVDLELEKVEVLNTVGDKPPALHSGMLSYINNTLVLYGGIDATEQIVMSSLFVLDLVELVWEKKTPEGQIPDAVYDGIMYPVDNHRIGIMGGKTDINDNKVSNEHFTWNAWTNKWIWVDTPLLDQRGLYGHKGLVLNHALYPKLCLHPVSDLRTSVDKYYLCERNSGPIVYIYGGATFTKVIKSRFISRNRIHCFFSPPVGNLVK